MTLFKAAKSCYLAPDMDNNSNLFAAILLSVLILIGFQYLYVKPQQEHYRQQVLAEKTAMPPKAEAVAAPEVAGTLRDRAAIISESPRIPISTPQLRGSINLKGARLDDLELVQYRETIDPHSPRITLLSPSGSAAPHLSYYAEFSWLGDGTVSVPGAQTEWKADGKSLSPKAPLRLNWSNGQGLSFERTIAIDDNFMITLTDRVHNTGSAPVTLYPFGLIARQGMPSEHSTYILHEGPLGVLNGTLEEHKYATLAEEGKKTMDSQGGWLGMTDKYWLVAMVPPQTEKLSATFAHSPGKSDTAHGFFQTDFRGAAMNVPAGGSIEHTSQLFAGAKRVRLLDDYGKKYDIPRFDRAIDFGWFYFLTKPFLYLLDYLSESMGSFALALLVFTVMLKLLTLPLTLKSNHSMARMKALQPEMKRIQERFADDRMKQGQEMMELYKREKVSPMSGCVPTLIQIPIFFALYKVLYVGIEMRQVPFYGWIKDMSAPDPTSVFTLFGLIAWTPPMALQIGIWPILMGLSMFLQQRLSPQPPDKTQARMFMLMPILFTYMLSHMPAGLVIYWTWSNLLSIGQQWFIMRQDARRAGKT
ncbi:MAG: membrane protein insertase YidC [Alphaproteobacteria bacterium]|nr:membrane protein insertase YidC [Alphaproteobacteria bacterium]